MSREPDETLEVLRGIWSAQGQTSADLDDLGTTKSCKRMADVGFGVRDGGEVTCAPPGGPAGARGQADPRGAVSPTSCSAGPVPAAD